MMLISKRLFVLLWIIHYLFLFRNKLQKNSLEDTYSLKNKNQKQCGDLQCLGPLGITFYHQRQRRFYPNRSSTTGEKHKILKDKLCIYFSENLLEMSHRNSEPFNISFLLVDLIPSIKFKRNLVYSIVVFYL